MTTATQTETRVASPETRIPRPLPARLLKALHAEWRKLSPNIESTVDSRQLTAREEERQARLAWTNEVLFSRAPSTQHPAPVKSWNELTQGQAKYLLQRMKEESGSAPAYRATLIARLAVELFGSDWNAILRERLVQRFRVPSPESLAPNEAHAEIEELLSRLARRDGVEIEEVRARFAQSRKSKVESRTSEGG